MIGPQKLQKVGKSLIMIYLPGLVVDIAGSRTSTFPFVVASAFKLFRNRKRSLVILRQ